MAKKRQQKKNRKKQQRASAGVPSTRLINEFKRLRGNTLAKLNRIEKNINDKARADAESQLNLNLSKTATKYHNADEMKLAIQEMKSFTNRHNARFQYVKNAYGAWMNKKEKNWAERQSKINIYKAEKELKRINKHLKNNPEYEAKALLLGKERTSNISIPNEFDFSSIKYQSTLRDQLKRIEQRSKPQYYDVRKARMQENYIDRIHLTFHSNADKLIKDIRSLSPDEFFDLYLSDFGFQLDFEDFYPDDLLKEDFGTIEQLRGVIKRYKKGEIDLSLKGL